MAADERLVDAPDPQAEDGSARGGDPAVPRVLSCPLMVLQTDPDPLSGIPWAESRGAAERPRKGEEPMALGGEAIGPIVVLEARGQLNLPAARDLSREVDRLHAAGCRAIVVDCRDVNRIAYLGLGLLMDQAARLRHSGMHLALAALTPRFQDMLDGVRATQVLPVYRSVEQALENFCEMEPVGRA
jgi:anti-anti-sigma factor